jgi:hypothetical protein
MGKWVVTVIVLALLVFGIETSSELIMNHDVKMPLPSNINSDEIERLSDLVEHPGSGRDRMCCFNVEFFNDLQKEERLSSNNLFSTILSSGSVYNYTFNTPGKYQILFGDSNATELTNYMSIRVYDPLTECDATGGCGGPTNPTMSQLPVSVQKQALILRAEIANSTNDTEKSQLENQLDILAKNDPNCIALDKTGQCIYLTNVQNSTTNTPAWTKKVFEWYDEGKISDQDLLAFVKWLIDNKIMGS